MLDQSGSMEDPMRASNGLALDVNAADAINSVINEMILKLTTLDKNGEDIVKRSAFVSIIGYGGKGTELATNSTMRQKLLLMVGLTN